jgi:ABC-2 type transport system permease protein
MSPLLAITYREFASFFRTSIGWVVIALFLLIAGLFVTAKTYTPGQPATMREFFTLAHWVTLMIAPAISMRLISEERRAGTIEPLMSAPVSEWAIAIAKYLGALAFFGAMIAPTLVYVGTLEAVANPDYGPIIAGYVGLVLVGALYLAVGLLASALSSSQIVAYLATLFFFIALWFVSSVGAQAVGPPYDAILYEFSINLRVADFAKGVIDTRHIAVLGAATAWFIAMTAVVLETRRWR